MSITSEKSKSITVLESPKQILTKANKIHYKLLSFIQNELNETSKNKRNIFISFYSQDKLEIIKEDKDIEYQNKKNEIDNDSKSNDTSFISDDENGEESSSNMSCSEESYIDLDL